MRIYNRLRWIATLITGIILIAIWGIVGNIGYVTAAITHFLSVISPLFFGILFAYFIYAPHLGIEILLKKVRVRWISKRARGFSTIIMLVVVLALIVIFISFVVPILVASILELAESIPAYFSELLNYLDNIPYDSFWAGLPIAEAIGDFPVQLMNTILDSEWLSLAAGAVFEIAGGLFSILLGLIISLYILHDRDRISAFFVRFNRAIFKNEKRQLRSARLFKQVNSVLFTFIASKGLDSLINFVVAYTVLRIANVPYALLLGIIAGIFNFIPFLGSLISAVLISVIALVTQDVAVAIPVAIALLIFNQLDANFIEPRIMKSSLKISPILVILAVVAGGAYFNIIGMFLGVPIAVVIMQLVVEYVDSSEITLEAHENEKVEAEENYTKTEDEDGVSK